MSNVVPIVAETKPKAAKGGRWEIVGRRQEVGVRTSATTERAAFEQLKRFEADPEAFDTRGEERREAVYLDETLAKAFLEWSVAPRKDGGALPRPGRAEGAAGVVVIPSTKDGDPLKVAVSKAVLAAAKRVRVEGTFDRQHFQKAVTAACVKAKVPSFGTGQLRHSVAT